MTLDTYINTLLLAYDQGRTARMDLPQLKSALATCPYTESSASAVDWLRGWFDEDELLTEVGVA